MVSTFVYHTNFCRLKFRTYSYTLTQVKFSILNQYFLIILKSLVFQMEETNIFLSVSLYEQYSLVKIKST